MQRWTALAFLATVLGASAAIVLVTRQNGEALALGSASALPSVSAPRFAPVPVPADGAGGAGEEVEPTSSEVPPSSSNDASAPSLPAGAPKLVSFGVVLVTYRGAQGARADARSKEVARTVAEDVAEKAKTDFAAAMKLGDIGFDDAGEMPRGVLEPGPEAALFALAAGEVSPPVDSPRGYYVFKRIE